MRPLDIALTDASGNPVRWRTGAHSRLTDLQFSSALPGGFANCSFVLEQPAARVASLVANSTAIVRCGSTIVWWGYVEDVETIQRGSVRGVAVTAYGPWQLFQQRLVTEAYDDVTSTYILRDIIAGYLPEISVDVSQLVNTGTPLTVDWTNVRASDAVKAVVDAGNSSDLPLLFAIWEPPGSRVQIGDTANLLTDSQFEEFETYWERSSSPGDQIYYTDDLYISPRYSWKINESTSAGIKHIARVPVAASTTYVIDYWQYWTAYSGMSMEARFDWYDAGNSFISTTFTTTHTSDGSTTGWIHRVDTITSPSGAVEVIVHITCGVGSGGGAARYMCVDDVKFYLFTTTLSAETKPRAYLWARDLSSYDYVLRTTDVEEGVTTVSTTRDLANRVLATYGSSSVTAAATDTVSQANYRQRDHLLAAGSVAQVDAEAMRDVYLARHSAPGTEVGSFRINRLGAVRTVTGQVVRLEMLRAGDRLLIGDGPLAGSIILLDQVAYRDGAVTCRPENYDDATRLLARI